jgi:hypothetical protein
MEKKVTKINMKQKYFIVSVAIQMVDYAELISNSSKGYEFLNAIKNYNVDTKYIIMYGDTVYFYDEIIKIETIVEDILTPLQKLVIETDPNIDPFLRNVFSTFEENVDELEEGTEVWIGMPNSDIFEYSLNVVGEQVTPYDELQYVLAYDTRNIGTDDEHVYMFVNRQPTKEMLAELKSANADFKSRLETDVRVNNIIHLWEYMEIEDPYDTFLDFTRYLFHRCTDERTPVNDIVTYQQLYLVCKELINAKIVPSLNQRMRKTIFVKGDEIAVYDRVNSVRCSVAELYGIFCDYAEERDVEEYYNLTCIYKHANIFGVDMLLRVSPETQSDLVRVPEDCDMDYTKIAEAIYDGRNPKYVPDDPDDEDSNCHPVYKNPDNIIPDFC